MNVCGMLCINEVRIQCLRKVIYSHILKFSQCIIHNGISNSLTIFFPKHIAYKWYFNHQSWKIFTKFLMKLLLYFFMYFGPHDALGINNSCYNDGHSWFHSSLGSWVIERPIIDAFACWRKHETSPTVALVPHKF